MSLLRLNASDNVAIALADLDAATRVDGLEIVGRVPRGHKVATFNIEAGELIRKFGQVIGVASSRIPCGSHVHVHNVSAETAIDAASATAGTEAIQSSGPTDFSGFRRADGRIGTRNYLGVIATVNCSATVVREIAARANRALDGDAAIDGVVPITHTTGCGMSSGGEGMEILRRTLGGFIRHPNFAGVLVLGLGCEANELGAMLSSQGLETGTALRAMTIQDAGGTRAAIEAGEAEVEELARLARDARRETVPASSLVLGLQCGGSDAFSAISANPALGRAADLLVAAGGTVILGETPEIHGAESLLLNRAVSGEVADALRHRLDWWQDYVARNDATLNNNPSPGNMDGGITTIYEKSLGAVAKSGTSPLRAVYRYGEPVTERGFVFMDSPGYDPCSVTGEIASGANMICFTTGRGSVFGAKPVPSIKLATNSEMARRMAEDMDFDCGPVLEGSMSVEEAGQRIFEMILEVASGRRSLSEQYGFGDFEFVPWQIGAVL